MTRAWHHMPAPMPANDAEYIAQRRANCLGCRNLLDAATWTCRVVGAKRHQVLGCLAWVQDYETGAIECLHRDPVQLQLFAGGGGEESRLSRD